jgi:hypothetical protein
MDSLPIYRLKDIFGSIPISTLPVPENKAMTAAYVLQQVQSINEKHGVRDFIFLGEFQ